MTRWFLMAMPPLKMQPAFTALTCTFSHASLAHLAFNMIAFSSFGGNMSQVELLSRFMLIQSAAIVTLTSSCILPLFCEHHQKKKLPYVVLVGTVSCRTVFFLVCMQEQTCRHAHGKRLGVLQCRSLEESSFWPSS